jgi:hypothetical protein
MPSERKRTRFDTDLENGGSFAPYEFFADMAALPAANRRTTQAVLSGPAEPTATASIATKATIARGIVTRSTVNIIDAQDLNSGEHESTLLLLRAEIKLDSGFRGNDDFVRIFPTEQDA